MPTPTPAVDHIPAKKPAPCFEDNDNLVRAELDVLLEEYELCTNRMMREVNSDDKGFEFNLVALGAMVVAITFAIDKKAYFLLLLLSLPFHLLTWSLARRNIWTSLLVSYMTTVLSPRINRLIQGSEVYYPGNDRITHFLSWERYHWTRLDQNPLLKVPIAMPLVGRAIFQVVMAVVVIIAYYLFKQMDPQYLAGPFDGVLVGLNVVFLAVSLFTLSIGSITWAKGPNRRPENLKKKK